MTGPVRPPTVDRGDHRPRLRPLPVFAVSLSFALLHAVYANLRALADGSHAVHPGRPIEDGLLGFTPSLFLQQMLEGPLADPLGYIGLAVHASWFPIVYVFGAVIMLRAPRKLIECLAMILTVSFLGVVIHYYVPMTPPWMDPEISRVMAELPLPGALKYFDSDDNVFAAFPSLHAALPMALGVFCLFVPRLRWLGGVGIAHATVTGLFLVYLGEHWVIDIVAGFALGSGVAVLFGSGALFAAIDRLPFHVGERLTGINAAVFPFRPEPAQVIPFPLAHEDGERTAA